MIILHALIFFFFLFICRLQQNKILRGKKFQSTINHSLSKAVYHCCDQIVCYPKYLPWNGAAIAIQLLTYFSKIWDKEKETLSNWLNCTKRKQHEYIGCEFKLGMGRGKTEGIITLTSLCRDMKHFTRRPPIEWLMIFIFFPPEAL